MKPYSLKDVWGTNAANEGEIPIFVRTNTKFKTQFLMENKMDMKFAVQLNQTF